MSSDRAFLRSPNATAFVRSPSKTAFIIKKLDALTAYTYALNYAGPGFEDAQQIKYPSTSELNSWNGQGIGRNLQVTGAAITFKQANPESWFNVDAVNAMTGALFAAGFSAHIDTPSGPVADPNSGFGQTLAILQSYPSMGGVAQVGNLITVDGVTYTDRITIPISYNQQPAANQYQFFDFSAGVPTSICYKIDGWATSQGPALPASQGPSFANDATSPHQTLGGNGILRLGFYWGYGVVQLFSNSQFYAITSQGFMRNLFADNATYRATGLISGNVVIFTASSAQADAWFWYNNDLSQTLGPPISHSILGFNDGPVSWRNEIAVIEVV